MLNAVHVGLGQDFLLLQRVDAPPQWQSTIIASNLPDLQQAQASASAPAGNQSTHATQFHSTAAVAHAAVTLHGLYANSQTASAPLFSYMQSLASLLELLAAVLATPGVTEHADQESMGDLTAALYRSTPGVMGHCSQQAQSLLIGISQHDEALVQSTQRRHYDERQESLLFHLFRWTVGCTACMCNYIPLA